MGLGRRRIRASVALLSFERDRGKAAGTHMKYRRLGRTNFEVSEIGYGAWGIGGKQWLGGSDDESLAALGRAIELGVNLIDTALAYGDGHSEKLVGKVVRKAGRKIFVATKVPPKNRIWPAQPGVGIEQVFPYDYIVRSAEESLRNLGLDAIDLLQLHVWNSEWIGREEWRRAFEDLKRSGKVRAVGISLSDHDPDSGLEAVRTGLIDAVQVIYNIFDQAPENSPVAVVPERKRRRAGASAAGRGRPQRASRREHQIRPRRFSRMVFPRRPQEAGSRSRGRAAEGFRRRFQCARDRAAILHF